jgi:hypothetical protein
VEEGWVFVTDNELISTKEPAAEVEIKEPNPFRQPGWVRVRSVIERLEDELRSDSESVPVTDTTDASKVDDASDARRATEVESN